MKPVRILLRSIPAAALVLAACGQNPAPGAAGAPGDPCAGAWVELFDDSNFSGSRLRVVYPTEHASLKERDLNDRVSSARWSIPAGCRLALYEDESFRGARFPLVGSGRTEQNASFGSFSDKASSARWERT